MRGILSALQGALVVIGLAWLTLSLINQEIVDVSRIDWRWLLLGVVINLFGLTAMGWRLHVLVAAWSIGDKATATLDLHFRSLFYLLLMPLGIGMEAARYLGFRAIFPDVERARLATVILADRGMAVGFLGAFAAIAWGVLAQEWLWMMAGFALAVGVTLFLILWKRVRLSTLLPALLACIVTHLLTVVAVQCFCVGVGLDIGFWALAFAISAGSLAAVVPIAIAGLSLGDAAVAGLLIWQGVDPVVAAAAAALLYLSRLLGAIVGGGLELKRLYGSPPL